MVNPPYKLLRDELELRCAPITGGDNDSRRLFHGRGRAFAGLEWLTVEWFAPVALCILYGEEGEPHLPVLYDILTELLGDCLKAIVVQRRYLPHAPSETVWGELPEEVYAVEAGLRYRLRLGQAQNIGFFLDMARGRELVRSIAKDRKVLNLFSYTCSFSVAALAGGADHVVNLDMNRGALNVGRENHRLNGLDARGAAYLAHDLFKSFGKLKKLGPFGVIIVDPPERQGASFTAERHWPKLVRKLKGLSAPGCEILAALNSPNLPPSFITDLFAKDLPGAELVKSFGAPEDFRETQLNRGLKLFHYRLNV